MRTRLILTLVLCLALTGMSAAQPPGSAIGAAIRLGSLGAGLEAATPLLPRLNLRVGYNKADLSYDTDYAGNDYEFDLGLQTVAALGDFHVFGGGFRITGGVMLNGNGLDVTGSPGGQMGALTFEIGDQVYDATSDVTAFNGEIEFNSLAPYAGIGFGNMVGEDKRLGFLLDIGAVLQGSPTITMSTVDTLDDTTPVPGDAQNRTPRQILLDNVAKEEAELEDDISTFNLYPVISLGISYRFM